MNDKQINELIDQAIAERSDLFLVLCKVSTSKDISIEIDSDQGATLDDCMMVSRYIESHLDREVEDFSLTVTTPDVTKPLVLARQYKKNMGRIMQVQTDEVKVEGRLVEITDEHLVLEYKARVPKDIGKGKQTITKQDHIAINSVKKAKVKIVFNS